MCIYIILENRTIKQSLKLTYYKRGHPSRYNKTEMDVRLIAQQKHISDILATRLSKIRLISGPSHIAKQDACPKRDRRPVFHITAHPIFVHTPAG